MRDRHLLHHAAHNAPLTPIGLQMANSTFPSLTCLLEQAAYGNHLNPFASAPTLSNLGNKHNSKQQHCQSSNSEPATASSPDTSTSRGLTNTWDTTSMCPNHCFIDSFCPCTNAQCKFFHSTTWAQLSAADKKVVTAYVNTNPFVEFSPSSGKRLFLLLHRLSLPAAPNFHFTLPVHSPATFSWPGSSTCNLLHICLSAKAPVTLYSKAKTTTPIVPLPTHPKDQLTHTSKTATCTILHLYPCHPDPFAAGIIQLHPPPFSKNFLRHVIPFLHNNPFLSNTDTVWLSAFSPARLYVTLRAKYYHLNTQHIHRFASYHQFKTETCINKHCICHSSAALPYCQMNIPCLARYLSGPHLAVHCDILVIPRCLHLGCNQPSTVCKSDPSELCKVLVKDSRHGNTILVNGRLFLFIPNLYSTPLGIANKTYPWKKSRQIFEASFWITPNSSCINDWTNKSKEPPVTSLGPSCPSSVEPLDLLSPPYTPHHRPDGCIPSLWLLGICYRPVLWQLLLSCQLGPHSHPQGPYPDGMLPVAPKICHNACTAASYVATMQLRLKFPP
eukprot:jgi/Psemu1/41190/gm1.41190_g